MKILIKETLFRQVDKWSGENLTQRQNGFAFQSILQIFQQIDYCNLRRLKYLTEQSCQSRGRVKQQMLFIGYLYYLPVICLVDYLFVCSFFCLVFCSPVSIPRPSPSRVPSPPQTPAHPPSSRVPGAQELRWDS